MKDMKCLRCSNTDERYFYKGSNGYYCRKCIQFSRVLIQEDLASFDYDISKDSYEYNFSYELTDIQKNASNKCLEYVKDKDVLLHCVCGAGKTEISVESISYFLSQGKKVAYAIARKEVVIELSKRFQNIFHNANVTAVYGGHHDDLTGDLIVCTCHQLYRYYNTFDLLILDEIDAFPMKGNETLLNIAINSCKGNIIYSTATIDDELQKVLDKREYKKVEVYTRPSNKPLIIPKVIYSLKIISILILDRVLKRMNNKCIIFVSSKKECELLYKLFKKKYSCTYVYSDLDNRRNNIEDFKNDKYQFIFSTSVLERGVTIKDVSVIIMNSLKLFDEANYVQMLGRVGRGVDSNYGDAYIISNHLDKNIDKTIKYLRKANSYLELSIL